MSKEIVTHDQILAQIKSLGYDTEIGSAEVCDLIRIAEWVAAKANNEIDALRAELDAISSDYNRLSKDGF